MSVAFRACAGISFTFTMDSWNSALMNVVSLGMYLLRTGYYCSSSNDTTAVLTMIILHL